MPWNQPKTSTKLGLGATLPAPAPPAIAELAAVAPPINKATPATAAATYVTAGTSVVFPLEISEVIQATSSFESRAMSSSVATAAISGTWKAMAGIWLAYCEEISCVPDAAKLPDGTGSC